jgi:hypothetical protein
MKNVRSLLAATSLIAIGAFAVRAQLAYTCTTATGPIVIDGIADEASWAATDSVKISLQAQPIIEQFGDDAVAAAPTLAKYTPKQVFAKTLWDSDALYFYFYAESPHLWNVREGRDEPGYFDENTFEVYLDPGASGTNYVEINISCRGDITDYYINWPYQSRENFDIAGIESAVRYLDGTSFCNSNALDDCNTDTDVGMTMELKVPFDGLGIERMAAEWADKADTIETIASPSVTEAAILDWDALLAALHSDPATAAATLLIDNLDAATADAIAAAAELDSGQKAAVVQALQDAVDDLETFTGVAADLTLRDTVIGGGEPAYPLAAAGAARADTLVAERDTVWVEGCAIIDTIQTTYSDTVIYTAAASALSRYQSALANDILDSAGGSLGLGVVSDQADTALLRWINVFLIEDLLFPEAITISGPILDSLKRTVDVADGGSIPPASGDSWKFNVNFVTSPPCSLFRLDYSWAPVGGNTHATGSFGDLAFAGSPDTRVIVSATRGSLPGRLRIAAAGPHSVAIDYTVRHGESPVSLRLYTADGRLAATLPANAAPGDHQCVWDRGRLGNGAYIVRLHAGETITTRRMYIAH